MKSYPPNRKHFAPDLHLTLAFLLSFLCSLLLALIVFLILLTTVMPSLYCLVGFNLYDLRYPVERDKQFSECLCPVELQQTKLVIKRKTFIISLELITSIAIMFKLNI